MATGMNMVINTVAKMVRRHRTSDLDLGSLRRRRPTEWGIRLALALIAAWLGYVAVMQSVAMSVQIGSPITAHRLAPGNGFITGQLSAEFSLPDASNPERARSIDLARLALLQDPTSVDAAVTLAGHAQLNGDTASARRLFAYSQILSRHDLRTQSWAIQDAGARGSVPDTLRHYDTILRTSQDATTVLYPALASAISDPKIRAALVKTLSHQPSWTQGFIGYVGANSPDPEATASFFLALQRAQVQVADSAAAAVVNALISKQQFNRAWSYYASTRKGADRRTSRDPKFAANIDTPTPFDWTPSNDDSISATIQRSGRGGVFTFAAPASIGGEVLQQVEMLAPGDYVLEGRSEDVEQPTESMQPYWSLVCQGARELGRSSLSNSTAGNGHFSARFTVPVGCPVQILALNARPSSNVSGVSGQIDWVLLRPAE